MQPLGHCHVYHTTGTRKLQSGSHPKGFSQTKTSQPQSDGGISLGVMTEKQVEDIIRRASGRNSDITAYEHLPPYPREIASKPYPPKYKPPTFPMFDGKSGNAKEHLSWKIRESTMVIRNLG